MVFVQTFPTKRAKKNNQKPTDNFTFCWFYDKCWIFCFHLSFFFGLESMAVGGAYKADKKTFCRQTRHGKMDRKTLYLFDDCGGT